MGAPLPRNNPRIPSLVYISFIICTKYPRFNCLSLICIRNFTKSNGVVKNEAIAAAEADMNKLSEKLTSFFLLCAVEVKISSLIFSLLKKKIEEYGPNEKIVAKYPL